MRKIDKNKVYRFIGQATVYATIYAMTAIAVIWSIGQTTVYK